LAFNAVNKYYVFYIHNGLSRRDPENHHMKPQPAPNVPGNTEAERFDNAVRKVFSVSKDAYLKEEARLKKLREPKKWAKKTAS
jgi:hypothetical protein